MNDFTTYIQCVDIYGLYHVNITICLLGTCIRIFTHVTVWF